MTSELDILGDWIRQETGHKGPIGPDDDLLEARILDSFSIVTIAVFIQDRFGIELQAEDLVRSKMGRLSSMVALIEARRPSGTRSGREG
jgi:acyl carrier protein